MDFDVVVVGAGPAGYAGAIRCSQLGFTTAIIEKQYLGGTCLNVGCIPSKALIHASSTVSKISHADVMGIQASVVKVDFKKMLLWKEGVVAKLTGGVKGLLKSNKVEILSGAGKFVGKNSIEVNGQKVNFKYAMIATGSEILDLPFAKPDGKRILNSTHALALDQIPTKLVVVGGGFIGMEIGMVYRKLGSEVRVIDRLDHILSGTDRDCVAVVEKKCKSLGIQFQLGVNLKSVTNVSDKVILEIDGSKIEASHVLMTVGRKPHTEKLGLEILGITLDKLGRIPVDKNLRTTVPHIFAVGDVIDGPMLAHKASYEALAVADIIKGSKRDRHYRALPWAIFTDPEIATCGLTEEKCKELNKKIKISKFPFAANGRAISTNETDGFVKLIADAKTDELLGCHIVGPEASNLIAEYGFAQEMGASAEDLSLTIHAHPTLPEAIMEASEGIHDKMIHMFQKRSGT